MHRYKSNQTERCTMLFADDATSVAGEVALYAAAAGGVVAVLGALFTGLGALLNSWYANRGKVKADDNKAKADTLFEYKALYDASRSEIHTIRNEFNQAHLAWQAQAEQDRRESQKKLDEARLERQTQVAVLTTEVFKLHEEHAACMKSNGELSGDIKVMQLQINTLQTRANIRTDAAARPASGLAAQILDGDKVKVVVEGDAVVPDVPPPGAH